MKQNRIASSNSGSSFEKQIQVYHILKIRFHHSILSRNKMGQKATILWFAGDVEILKDGDVANLDHFHLYF